jgi:hypothetical protein
VSYFQTSAARTWQLEVTICDIQEQDHESAPLQLSLLSYFKSSIYYSPLSRESAQRTTENSPAIYRWDPVQTKDRVRKADD